MAHVDVQFLVVEDQLDLHVGVKRQEFLHLVGQPALAETDRRGDAQLAGRLVGVLGQLNLDAFQLHQHFMGGAIKNFALFGEDQAAGMAMKQLDADILLERAHLAADGRLGQMQLVGRMGERSRFRRRMENTQFVPV